MTSPRWARAITPLGEQGVPASHDEPLTRRRLLQAGGAIGAFSTAGCDVMTRLTGGEVTNPESEPLPINVIEDLAQRTFHFFWETTNPTNGLTPDRWPRSSPSSIAAVGFALTAYCIGVERGYVTREEARRRTLLTLRFLRELPQGPGKGVAGYKGFFYHFLEMDTGLRAGDCELSTVDTALLLCGALHAQAFFDSEHPEDVHIRRVVNELTTRVDWRWGQTRPPAIALGWTPEKGFIPYDWRGYNEAAIVYLLAMGHPTRPLDGSAWTAWTKDFHLNWSTFHGQQGLNFPPLFGHQYSNIWVDFRELRDAFSRRHNLDYAENSRRAAYAQRAYSMLNPLGWRGYDAGQHDRPLQRAAAALLRLCRARRGRRQGRVGGRRHDRAHRRHVVDRLCAGHRDSRDHHDDAALRHPHLRQIWLHRCLQPEFPLRDDAPVVWQGRTQLRLGGHRLPRHRPGADPGDDCQLHQRFGLADDDQVRAAASRPAARGLQRGLARGGSMK
jgi:hypothetical protein